MHLTTLAAFIPPTLLHELLADPAPHTTPRGTRFPAAALFADVSGFTALAEELAERGAGGAEALTSTLNATFRALISAAEDEGGAVVKFSGDALTVLFPQAADETLAHAARRAWQAAQAMQDNMADLAYVALRTGGPALALKLGVGAGETLALRVGGVFERWEYVVAGAALEQAAAACGRAAPGAIVLSPSAMDAFLSAYLEPRPLSMPALDTLPAAQAEPVLNALRRYVPAAVAGWLDEGLAAWLAVLRTMSLLFVGVRGLDYAQADAPERLHAFVRAAQSAIYHYEGSINKFVVDDKGSVLLVLFGAPPFAHADDPRRAVQCALDLRALAAEHGLTLALGVASGPVFAGPVGSAGRREYTVIGDAVNLAARLMAAADGDNIYCDYEVYRQARAQIHFETLAPLQLKGKAAPVRIYAPRGLRPPAPENLRVPLVGRMHERTRLRTALEAVQAGGHRVLYLEGEAGIGKSRLVYALVEAATQLGLHVLAGAGYSVETRTPYRAWRDVLSEYFDLHDLSAPAERGARVQTLASVLAPDELERLPVLNDLLGLDLPQTPLTDALDPKARNDTVAVLVIALLRGWARRQPVLLVLDDAHWLDSLSWELALHVARGLSVSQDRLLLLIAARPLDERAPSRMTQQAVHALPSTEALALSALEPEALTALVASRLGVAPDAMPDALVSFIQHRAEGNPFFAEEWVSTLREQGLLKVTQGAIVLQDDLMLSAQTLPTTLHGLILARVDRLPPERQLILKVAAVIGRTFPYRTLFAVLSEHAPLSADGLHAHLDALTESDLTQLDVPDPELTYIFKHIITQEVAYQSLLYAQRRTLHVTVAHWYEQTFSGAALAPYYPLITHHYHHADEPFYEQQYARRAGEHAAQQGATADAATYYTRALELTPADEHAERWELLLAREAVYSLRGQRPEQKADLAALAEQAQAHGTLDDQLMVAMRRGRCATVMADPLGTHAAADEVQALAERAGRLDYAAAAWGLHGEAYFRQGDHTAAQVACARALEMLEPVPDGQIAHEARINAINQMALVHLERRELDDAQAEFERVIALNRVRGTRAREATVINNFGVLAFYAGDSQKALAYFAQAMQVHRALGNRVNEGRCLISTGMIAKMRGDYDHARTLNLQAIRIARETGDPSGENYGLSNLGRIYLNLGDYAQALALQEESLRLAESIGDRVVMGWRMGYVARVWRWLGEFTRAEELQNEALAIAYETNNRFGVSFAQTYLGEIYEQRGEWERAETAYAEGAAIRRNAGEATLFMESLAGQARMLQALGQGVAALELADEIYTYLQTHELDAIMGTFLIYLTVHDLFRVHARAEAVYVLADARARLLARAARLQSAAERAQYLQAVPQHRVLLEGG